MFSADYVELASQCMSVTDAIIGIKGLQSQDAIGIYEMELFFVQGTDCDNSGEIFPRETKAPLAQALT